MLPLDYLQEIEHASFLLEEADCAKIRCVELLRAVGYLDATITRSANGDGQARVARITWMGGMVLVQGKDL
ncbi:hypothetical protein [Variovorax paradoxus]|uniref:hypothetical protein n=1 Tax=Variovorax paradoxus TaxID=34073 RepID=UPI003D64EE14